MSEPEKKYVVRMAETDASNKGIMEIRVRSRLNISIAKIIAATGALNKADMAPAAAQPINKVLEAWFILKIRERLELIAAPETTVGPSNPTDPPKPTVIGAVINDA